MTDLRLPGLDGKQTIVGDGGSGIGRAPPP